MLGSKFQLHSNFKSILCKQTVHTLIRGCVLWRLIWFCNVCQCIIKRTPVSQFILPPGQLDPRGASQPWLPCPPGGGQAVPGYLAPTLVIFTPGGQAVQAGLSCPPPNTSKKYIHVILLFFCIILMNSDPP